MDNALQINKNDRLISEINKTAYKNHRIVVWVAIVLNPVWAIGDYFTIPEYFGNFLIFRLAVAFVTFIVFLFRKRLLDNPAILAFIPVLGISIQNAYMYSVMNIAQIQTHTFAYIALFIGAGMLVLWDKKYSISVVIVSFIANVIFFKLHSTLTLAAILINGGMLSATVAIFTIILISTRTNLIRKEIVARLALTESNTQLEEKNGIIETKNKSIIDSINYAKNIQYTIVPSEELIKSYLPNSFVFYRPKDIVSGDFPYLFVKNNCIYIATVDCTGHGVPGAFMSLLGYFSLNQILSTNEDESPGEILNKLHELVVKTLGQDLPGSKSNDGMDIAICKIKKDSTKIEFAGAHRPLYLVKNDKFEEIKSDKSPIGGVQLRNRNPYRNFEVELEKGDSIYFFTDGLPDQFGGKEGKEKFMSKKVKDLIGLNHKKNMPEFKEVMTHEFDAWKTTYKQMDDVLMIGIKF